MTDVAPAPSTPDPEVSGENPQFETPRKEENPSGSVEDTKGKEAAPETIPEVIPEVQPAFNAKKLEDALARAAEAEKKQKELEAMLESAKKEAEEELERKEKEKEEMLKKREEELGAKAAADSAALTEELEKTKEKADALDKNNEQLKTTLADLERKALEDAIDRANKAEVALLEAGEKNEGLKEDKVELGGTIRELEHGAEEMRSTIKTLQDKYVDKMNEVNILAMSSLVASDKILQATIESKDEANLNTLNEAKSTFDKTLAQLEADVLFTFGYNEIILREAEAKQQQITLDGKKELDRVVGEDKAVFDSILKDLEVGYLHSLGSGQLENGELRSRIKDLEETFYLQFGTTTNDHRNRIEALEGHFYSNLVTTTNDSHARIDELGAMNMELVAHHTEAEKLLQDELVRSVASAAAKETALKIEVQNYEQRMSEIEHSFYGQLALTTNNNTKRVEELEESYFQSLAARTNDWHSRVDEVSDAGMAAMACSTNQWWKRVGELEGNCAELVTHHTSAEESLQNELIASVSGAAVAKASLSAEIRNLNERISSLEGSYFSSFAVSNEDMHERIDSLNASCAMSMALNTQDKFARFQELESMAMASMAINVEDKFARIGELEIMAMENFAHRAATEQDLQNELIATVSNAVVTKAALTSEIRNYDERLENLENSYFTSFSLNNLDMHERLDSISSTYFASLSATNNDWWQRTDEIEAAAMQLFAHTTATEAGLQNELITLSTKSALKETCLQAEVDDYAARTLMLENAFFSQFVTSTNDLHDRVTLLTSEMYTNMAVNTNDEWKRIDEFSEMWARELVHHTRVEAQLQDELITTVSKSAIKEAALTAEINDCMERIGVFEDSFYRQFVTTNDDLYGRLGELSVAFNMTMATNVIDKFSRLGELEALNSKQLVHHTEAEAKFQIELIGAVTAASLKETTLTSELNNCMERFDNLENAFFVQLATNTNDKFARIGELEQAAYGSLAVSTNDWWARTDELSDMCLNNFAHHTDVEAKLQSELISLSAESSIERLAHSTEVNNLTERMSHIESSFFENFAVTNNDFHARLAALEEAGYISLALSTNHWYKIVDELSSANATMLAHHTQVEADLQSELINEVTMNLLQQASLQCEISSYEERMESLEARYFASFSLNNADLHGRLSQINESYCASLAVVTNDTWARISELENSSSRLISHHTRVEADFQNELITLGVNSALKEVTMQTEQDNMVQRLSEVEGAYFTSLAARDSDWHGRMKNLEEKYFTSLVLTTKANFERMQELETLSMKQLAHHTEIEMNLQNELIDAVVGSTLKETRLKCEVYDYEARVMMLEGSFFGQFAVNTNEHHQRVEELEGEYLKSLAVTNQDMWRRMDELTERSLEVFAHNTEVVANLQKELVESETRATLIETRLKCEVQAYEARVGMLEGSFFEQFAVNNVGLHNRLDELEQTQLMALAATTSDSWKRMDELTSMSYELMEHHSSEEHKLQDELIGSVASGVMEKMLDKVVADEKVEESENRGKMTANEVELRTDQIFQLKDRVKMMDLDLEGYMGRRRELRDRMHKVSSVVKDWKGKIRRAGSSLIKAQTEKSRYSKVKPVLAGAKLFSVGMGGNANQADLWGR